MRVFEVCEIRRIVVGLVFLCLHFPGLNGEQASHYVPSLDSLNRHPLPQMVCRCQIRDICTLGSLLCSGLGPSCRKGRQHSAGLRMQVRESIRGH